MRSSASEPWLSAHAERLTAHLSPADRRHLADAPAAAVTGDGVTVRTGAVRPGECGLDGLYVHGDDGPVITYTPAVSSGRNNFTILHEYGHHLCNEDTDLAMDLLDRDDGDLVEEDLADQIAASLLLPADRVAEAFADGLTAQAVADLFGRTRASREACCVAAAKALPRPGYAVLADPDGTVRFAAPAGTPFRIARNTAQHPDHLLARAGRNGRARGETRLIHATGSQTPPMHADAVLVDGYVFGLFSAGRASWVRLHLLTDDRPGGRLHQCASCDREFPVGGTPCSRCGDPVCYSCQGCGCEQATRSAERLCTECNLRKGVAQFDGDGDVCRDCV